MEPKSHDQLHSQHRQHVLQKVPVLQAAQPPIPVKNILQTQKDTARRYLTDFSKISLGEQRVSTLSCPHGVKNVAYQKHTQVLVLDVALYTQPYEPSASNIQNNH